MGEANARAQTDGWITKKEQILLGMLALNFGRTDPSKGGKEEPGRLRRALKARLVEQLGVEWIRDRIEEMEDPARKGEPLWKAEERTSEKIKITLDRDVLAYLIEELDKVPVGGGDDVRIHVLEDRFADMKAGNLRMPPELEAPAEADARAAATAILLSAEAAVGAPAQPLPPS
jgi:hypothetical protein